MLTRQKYHSPTLLGSLKFFLITATAKLRPFLSALPRKLSLASLPRFVGTELACLRLEGGCCMPRCLAYMNIHSRTHNLHHDPTVLCPS